MGHAALGLMLGIVPLLGMRGRAGRDALGLTPGLLVLLIVSANLPDALHVGDLRLLTHNLPASLGLSLALALLFRPILGLGSRDMAAVVLAGLAHPVGDILFAAYYPFVPFNTSVVDVFPWNGGLHLATESLLSVVALGILLHPRLSGRRLLSPWRGRDHFLTRLALYGLSILLAGNLAVLALENYVREAPSAAAVILSCEGLALLAVILRVTLAPLRGGLGHPGTRDDA